MSSNQRIFVYGSCVSRDTLEFLDPEKFQLVDYLARHSLLSAGTDASYKLPADLQVPSDFQARMIQTDWQGQRLSNLASLSSTVDLLMWDLIDERHGVHWFPTGEIVTRSIDVLGSEPASSLLLDDTRIPFGSNTHFEGWAEKAREFVNFLKEHGLLERTRLIRVNWAQTVTDGTEVPSSMGISSTEANADFQRYYTLLKSLDVPTIEVPEDIVQADPNHRWGLAPFHYVPAVYEYIGAELGLLAR